LGEAIDIHFLEKRCLNRSRGWVFPFLRGTRVARDVFERAAFVCNVSIDEQHFAIAELSAFKDSLPLCFSRVAKHVMSSGCLLNVLRVSDQKFYAKMCLMKETQTAISHLEIKLRSTEIDALRRKNDIMNKEQIVLRDKIIPLPPSLNRTSNSQTKIVNFDIERANKEEPSRPEIIECNEESRKLDTTDCSQFVRNQNNKRQGIITSQDEVKTRQKSLAKATLEEAYEELFRDADHRASAAKWRNLRLDRIPVAKHELIQLEETDKRLYQNMNVDNAGVNGGIGTEEYGKSQDTTSCETQSTPQKNDIEVHEKEKDVTESMTDGVLSMTKFHHSQNYVRTENSKSVSTPPTFKSQQIRKDAFVSGKLASEEKEGNRADGCDNVPNSCLMSESYDMTHTSNLQVGSARSVHNNTVVQHKLSCDISAPLKSDVINTKEISPTKDISLKMKEERKLTAHAPDRVDSIPLRSSSAKKESTTDNKGSHERESQKDTHKEWTTEILGRLGASSCRSPSLREHELYSSQHLRPLNGTYSSCLLPQNSYYGFVDSTCKSLTNDLIQSEPRHNDLKSMERLDEDVPIEVAFQSCLIDPIMRQCAMVENLTALYFVYSVKVFDHISYLRSTMLGINYLQEMVIAFGDLKKASMQLSCISLKGPNILQLVENVHNTCATLSNARHHDKCNLYFSYHMSPNARKENESNHNRSKFSFQFDFVAKYQPPKPLNLIIDNSSMLLYNSIQQVLLRHLEANHLMSTLWKKISNAESRSYRNRKIGLSLVSTHDAFCKLRHHFNIFRYKVQCMMSIFSSYIALKLNFSWNAMEQFYGVNTFDEQNMRLVSDKKLTMERLFGNHYSNLIFLSEALFQGNDRASTRIRHCIDRIRCSVFFLSNIYSRVYSDYDEQDGINIQCTNETFENLSATLQNEYDDFISSSIKLRTHLSENSVRRNIQNNSISDNYDHLLAML